MSDAPWTRVQLRLQPPIATLRLEREAIDQALVDECTRALDACGDAISVLVIEGGPQVFCAGADLQDHADRGAALAVDPDALYALWRRLAEGPFISIAHVRGKASAGGVGFAAACDIVLADAAAAFSLPELLFGLHPACVLPFLVRRVGFQRAHFLTLSTRPIGVAEAVAWRLVDAWEADSTALLRRHLQRLRHLPRDGIARYKAYARGLHPGLEALQQPAVAANRALFGDAAIRASLERFARSGLFPWEADPS
jgi:polyketide biosynthesis enoyl-CoA hydratase PksH